MTDLDSGREAFQAGDHGRALDLLLPLARAGDVEARYLAGRTYLDDLDENPCRSVSEGAYWLELAADQGEIRAAYKLGTLFKHGHHDLRPDRGKAAGFLQRALALAEPAAEAGSAEGQFLLGSMYWRGDGVRKNGKRGLHWLRLAAEQGDVEHQSALGAALWWAPGPYRDMEEAVIWATRAAEQGHTGVQYHLAASYASADDVPLDFRKAAKWYRRAAKQGHAEATYNLSTMYLDGEGMPRDPLKAIELLNRAADLGFADAMRLLSAIHAHGLRGQPLDPILAANYLLGAFQAGDTLAPSDLAREITDGHISTDALCAALLHIAAEPGVT